MKQWSIIIAAALVATWLVVDTVREFFANETIQYFSSEPHRLLYVASIAIAGGFAALGFTRLSPRAETRLMITKTEPESISSAAERFMSFAWRFSPKTLRVIKRLSNKARNGRHGHSSQQPLAHAFFT